MKRSEFIKRGLFFATVGISISSLTSSCYKSDEDDPNPTTNSGPKDCLANGTRWIISSNHGHDLNVSKDDVKAGSTKTYSIEGGANHNHDVTITSSHFSSLQNNQSIEVVSTDAGHMHTVTVSCA